MPIIVDANTATTKGIVTSAIMSTYDVLDSQYHRELVKRFGDQYTGFFDALNVLGRRTPVAGESWTAAEENRYYPTVTVAGGGFAGGVGTTGSPITLTLASTTALRLNQEIMFPDETIGYVYAITGNNYSIVSVAGDTLPAANAGVELMILSNGWGDGTTQPTTLRTGVSQVTFYNQIFKESIGIEGGALTLAKWFDVKNDPTGPSIGNWTPELLKGEQMLNRQIDGALMWGRFDIDEAFVVPNGVDGAGNTVYLTKGFVPWVRERGLVHEIPASGGFGTGLTFMDDLDTIALYLKQNGITSGFCVLGVGPELDSRIQDSLKDYNNGGEGGPDYKRVVNTIFGGKDDLALSVNFKVVYRQGINFIIWVMDGFADPTGLGLTAYNAMNMGFAFPVSKYMDPKTRLAVDNLAVRYRQLGDYNRFMEVWSNGAAGGSLAGQYIGTVDKLNTYWRAHLGLQAVAANQFVVIDPTGAT